MKEEGRDGEREGTIYEWLNHTQHMTGQRAEGSPAAHLTPITGAY